MWASTLDASNRSSDRSVDGGNPVISATSLAHRRREIAASLPSAHYLTDEHRHRRERLIRREAAASARSLTASAARTQTITVRLPWHHAVVRARNRYREHVNAWNACLRRLSRDPASLDEPTPTIAATRAASKEAFRAALPPAALHYLDQRINALYAH